jgi:hypothetical protein
MSKVWKSMLLSAALVFSPLAVGPLSAQSSDPAWLDELRQQLAADKACEVNYFLNMREGRIGTNDYFEARVQCLDGRMFDASRTDPEKTFAIRACGVAVC